MLEDQVQKRKSIQEMDCFVVDAVLAVSFDWRELANRLNASHKKVPRTNVGNVPEPLAIYRMAHAVSHADFGFAQSLTQMLNLKYRAQIEEVDQMSSGSLCAFMNRMSTDKPYRLAGLIWALSSDPRPCVEKIVRYFLHRSLIQFFSSGFRAEGEAETLAELEHMFKR